MALDVGRSSARALLAVLVSALLCLGTVLGGTPAGAAAETRDRFIVTVADSHDSRAVAADHRRGGAQVDRVYTTALNGFAGAMSQADLAALQRDRRVTRIERDGLVTASATTVQDDATWGLDRIDTRERVLDTKYTYDSTGLGVHAYVVDTGIELTHAEFTGRLAGGYDAVTPGGSADDCNGHGTHVAGTVAGTVYGVAKQATLHPVRVLDCAGSGSWSGVIAGLDWVARNRVKPAVANLSLGGGASSSVDDAVRRTIDTGVTVVVAAGNGNSGGKEQDACGYSPARVAEALTIGATSSSDAKTSWSNYGPCVDLFAPGASITSAWHTSSTATNTISGTSMAAPHVAGVAALYLQQSTGASPAAVAQAISDAATKNVVTSSKTESNHLLHSRLAGTESSPDDPEPGTPGDPEPTSFSLTASGYKLKGAQHADLGWSGAESSQVDVYRDGARVTTTPNDGAHTDAIGSKGGGSYAYRLCEAGTSTCSNTVTVTF